MSSAVFRLLTPSLVIALAIGACTGCYATKVWQGDKGDDVAALQPGVTRATAEAVLGAPMRAWTASTNIRYATYEYYAGTPGSSRGFILTIFSFGVIEIGYALNLVQYPDPGPMGRWMMVWDRVVLAYDQRDVILGIFDEFDDLPPDGRSGQHKWKPVQTVFGELR